MKRFDSMLIVLASLLLATGACQSQQGKVDRQPAVAGQFYPADKTELAEMLKELFERATPSKKISNVIAIICPHAGYIYSGEVAASSFNQIDPSKQYDNIFIIGSSHYVAFEGASIYDKGNFITPLGTVEVNISLAKELIGKYSFFSDREDAHLREHCIEAQVPFLQYCMKKNFKIVPIVLGTQTPEMCKDIADALRQYLSPKNLFVISSDFSHYPPYENAETVDRATGDAILSNSPMNLLKTMDSNARQGVPNLATSLCGWTSVLTLLYMTESNSSISLIPVVYKNSGDSQAGDKSRVVGYYSIVIASKPKKDRAEFDLSSKDKDDLLSIARNAIELYVTKSSVPVIDTANLSSEVKRPCGAFVTLHENNQLRGCIGHFEPNEPLYSIVQQMAIAAATQDYRFPTVQTDELKKIDLEISVLTPLRKINSIDEIELGKHGIYIKKGMQSGTFLPEVATETHWTKEEFLGHCAQEKAGIGWDGWKDADIYVYEALVFHEK